jgi:hypothetical protein
VIPDDELAKLAVKSFVCPSRRQKVGPYADYAGAFPFWHYGPGATPTTVDWAYHRTALGDARGVKLSEIQDGLTQTFLLTEKWVRQDEAAGGLSDGDQAWDDLGPALVPCISRVQGVSPSVEDMSHGRYSYNAKRGWATAMNTNVPGNYTDAGMGGTVTFARDSAIPANDTIPNVAVFGTPHSYGIQPVAFCDGAVLLRRNVLALNLTILDGKVLNVP